MTSLDRLIQRVEYPLKVSIEDALDVIQKYWDEAANTVSTYWKDTDEEVAEELGVTPAAVAQLLDDNRPGYAYANIGGNSGVASYDYGPDWMVVNFTTGSRYIYTLKSTTPESMGYLKKYAQEGKGLNSYIMRMLREDYAGKNVKGVILIKPGMERYYEQANKRLQLLYAYRNTVSLEQQPQRETKMSKTVKQYEKQITDAGADGLDPVARQFMAIGLENIVNDPAIVYTPVGDVVSVEGIWQSIKDFFANRPTKIHLVGKDPDLRNKLRRTIGDPTWLSRQKYTLGQVNYRALPDFTPQTAQSYVQRYKAAVNAVSQHNSREMLKIKDALKIAVNALSMYSNGRQTSTAPLDLAIARINPYMIRLNINLKEPELMETELVSQTGDALTKVEVRMFSDLIGTVHGVQTTYEGSLRVSMSLPNAAYVKSLYAPRPSTPHAPHVPNPDHAPIYAAISRLEQAYSTITYMVNAEIKQRITTHAAWINAENIADSLVNYIGKSITNVTTNSFEAFNEPTIPTTQELKAACETYLVASNEGIFDTLKKLFSGPKKAEIVAELPIASIDVAAKFTNGPDTALPAVTMTGSKTAIFLSNGKYNPNWIADLQRDVLAYDKIIKDLSKYDQKLEAWENKWASKLDAFNGNADREDEFVELLKKMQADEPKPYFDVFSNSHDFVIWGKDNWEDGEEGFSREAHRAGSATVEIDEVPTGKVGALKKLITNTANLIRIAEDGHYEMYGHGPDFTDAPYRGYSQSDKAVEVMNKLRMHAHVSNDPFDCLHQVTVRLELILEDLANYLTLVNKHQA
jgi:hypothetical protein